MMAIAERWPIEESAVQAIAAGCDAVLICRSEELQERGVRGCARVEERAADAAFEARCPSDAHARFVAMRRGERSPFRAR